MAATPARISFILQEFRRAISETPGVAVRHGQLARRDDQPVETFFSDPADAQAMADARQELLSPERRRFSVTVRGLEEVMDLEIAGPIIPQGRFIDTLRGIDRDTLIAEVGFDFATQRATLVAWG